ncbi:hypothetical protein E9993_14920 [Labilibacter sediminis]|nr:hypothetical protein E9993_14920 [Labilibacter sediminis]
MISLIILVFSCNRDSEEESIEYPLVYESFSILESDIKVYTKNGELTLVDLKEDIIKRYKNNLSDVETNDFEGKIVVTYLAENIVKLTLDNNAEERNRQVKEYKGLIYWEKQDTSSIIVDMNFYASSILKYQPLYYEEFDVPTSTGYIKVAKYKECFFAKKKGNGFEVPMFDYVCITEFEQSTITGINNEITENSLPLIGENDTIIIQEYKIEMK